MTTRSQADIDAMTEKELISETVTAVRSIIKLKTYVKALQERLATIPPGNYRVGTAVLRLTIEKGKQRSEVIEITEDIDAKDH